MTYANHTVSSGMARPGAAQSHLPQSQSTGFAKSTYHSHFETSIHHIGGSRLPVLSYIGLPVVPESRLQANEATAPIPRARHVPTRQSNCPIL